MKPATLASSRLAILLLVFILNGCAPHRGVDAPVSPTVDVALVSQGIGSHRMRVGPTELHYLAAGERGRKLVVFLHGFPESSLAWKNYLPVFADNYYVVAPDLRGYGESTIFPEVSDYRWERLVADIRGLITGLGYQDAYVVGHDWGGSVAWLLAIESPQMVKKLVVFNSPHPFLFNQLYTDPRSEQHRLFWHYRAFVTDSISAEDLRANEEGLLKLFAFSQRSASEDEVAAYVRQWRRPGAVEAMVNYYKAMEFTTIPSWMPAFILNGIKRKFQVNLPVMVLWGDRDSALSVENLRGLDAFVPKLRVERFSGSNHWSNHQLFPDVVPMLKGFFES